MGQNPLNPSPPPPGPGQKPDPKPQPAIGVHGERVIHVGIPAGTHYKDDKLYNDKADEQIQQLRNGGVL